MLIGAAVGLTALTPIFLVYVVLMVMGSWIIPLITSYLPHDPDGADELSQTRVFRGHARVKNDTEITAEDIAQHNLVLWGDPGSNQLLATILPQLPLKWTRTDLILGTQTVAASDHAPILIYPNPLNREHYVVLNSSFTFRQGSTTSNSLQTPKLPDWAIIDLRTPPSLEWPGLVANAGFFNERWQFQ